MNLRILLIDTKLRETLVAVTEWKEIFLALFLMDEGVSESESNTTKHKYIL